MSRKKITQKDCPIRDRFIQARTITEHMSQHSNDTIFECNDCINNTQTRLYKMLIQSQLLGLQENCIENVQSGSFSSRLFAASKLPFGNQCTSNRFSLSPLNELEEAQLAYSLREERVIPKTPYKVLDAPSLQDDFYLDVLHWSQSNIIAVGLGKSLYLWEALSSKITKLLQFDGDDSVASVAWSPKGNHLAVGSNKGLVQVWDYPSGRKITSAKTHKERVGTMSWSPDGLILSTGSRDKSILYRDIRSKYTLSSIVNRSVGHKQEVCGVRWSPDGQYVSSGGNDNKVLIWNKSRLETPCLKFAEHKAAVKALAWSNYQNGLLATGGGTADKCIKLWDILTGQSKGGINTGSQVCSMVWSMNTNELISTHGYSKNSVTIWKCNPLRSIAELPGYTSRVLYLAQSPDGQSIVTGSADETLRFWQVFPPSKRQLMEKQEWDVYPSQKNIR